MPSYRINSDQAQWLRAKLQQIEKAAQSTLSSSSLAEMEPAVQEHVVYLCGMDLNMCAAWKGLLK